MAIKKSTAAKTQKKKQLNKVEQSKSLKQKINNLAKKLKKWSTRKTTLWYAIWGMTLYMIVGTIYTLFSGNVLDSTMTSEWFGAMRWVVGLGGTITVAELVKTRIKPKQDEDEEEVG